MTNLDYVIHEGNGPHLLLVHGLLSSRSQWMLNIESLAEVCRPVTVELLGHHNSPSPVQNSVYTPSSYVEMFDAIREEIGAEMWFVCGYSLGAALTLRYALTKPTHTIGQIFTNSMSALANPIPAEKWKLQNRSVAKSIRTQGHPFLNKMAIHPAHARNIPEKVRNAIALDAAKHDPNGIAFTFEYTIAEASVRQELESNSVPALLTWGQFDRRFRPHIPFLESHMPNLEIVNLDAGHGVNMQVSEAFNDAIRNFIHKHSGTS